MRDGVVALLLSCLFVLPSAFADDYLVGYDLIRDEGTDKTRRGAANFIGSSVSVSDDSINNETEVTIAGSGLTGSGADTQLTYWTGASSLAGDAGLTYNATTDELTMQGNLTLNDGVGDSPTLNLTPQGTGGVITWSMLVLDSDNDLQIFTTAPGTQNVDIVNFHATGVANLTLEGDIDILGNNITATTNTDRFVFMANGTTYAPEAIDLGTDTTGNYAAGDAEAGAALTGDSATAFFSAGTMEVARGGTGAAPGADDQLLVSDSTSAATWQTLTDCTGAGKALTYATATNALGCNTITGGGITGLTADSGGTTTGTTVTLEGGSGITTTRSIDTITSAFAPTELSSLTWGAGAFTTMTFDAGATDPVLTAASGALTLTTGNLGVATSSKFNLEGASGDTYLLFDGTTLSLYVNGVQMLTSTSSLLSIALPVPGDITLGNDATLRTQYPFFDGKIQLGSLTNGFAGLLFSGGANVTAGMNRHLTANTAGNSLTLQSSGATVGATNKAAGDLLLNTGVGTGTGRVANFAISAPAKGTASGTTDQTSVFRLIGNGSVALSSGVASTIATSTIAAGQTAGGTIIYSIEASNGTDFINASGQVQYSLVLKSATYTSNTSALTESQAKSDGTDTIVNTWAFAASSGNLQVTSTIVGMTASTYFRITYQIVSNSNQTISIP